MRACEQLLFELIETNRTCEALALIASGQCDLGYVGHPFPDYPDEDYTPLLLACDHRNETIALALIATGKSNPSYVNIYENIAIYSAHSARMSANVIVALIETGQSNIEYVDRDNNTFLEIMFRYDFDFRTNSNDVQMLKAIIKSNQHNQDHVDNFGFNALMRLCICGADHIVERARGNGFNKKCVEQTQNYECFYMCCYWLTTNTIIEHDELNCMNLSRFYQCIDEYGEILYLATVATVDTEDTDFVDFDRVKFKQDLIDAINAV